MRILAWSCLTALLTVVAPAAHLRATAGLPPPAGATAPRLTERRIHDERGTLRMRAQLRGEAFHGEYRTWYADGRPFEIRHYRDGQEAGRQQSWTPEGVLFLNYEVHDGRRYGLVNARPCRPVEESR